MAGVSRRTVQRILTEPEAWKIIRELTDARMALSRPVVIERMTLDAKKGDSSARRDYLQAGGDIGTGGHTTHVNVEQHNEAKEETLEDSMQRTTRERVLAGDYEGDAS